jgi:hypothetical protein
VRPLRPFAANPLSSPTLHIPRISQQFVTAPGFLLVPELKLTENFPMGGAINPKNSKANYRVLPLPRVQHEAQKILSPEQLREGIRLTKRLRFYPNVPDLDIGSCGLGRELRVEGPSIGQQGWLRAIVWIHEASKTIYIVDLFWKKTNKISPADR